MNKCGLYLHIPFCNKICAYCDFTKRVSKKDIKIKYLEYLKKEIKLYQENNFDFKKITSIYVGGGTPTALGKELLEELLQEISRIVDLSKIVEYTIEVNPEDLTKELIDLLVTYNVNRISIGIQTLDKKLLEKINRDFDYDKFIDNYKYLKQVIPNVNFDVMYAIPSQTIDSLKETLTKLVELEPTHFSIYSLILEEKTIFYNEFIKGKLELVSEELELGMVKLIHQLLGDKYPQYEVSNYSKNHQSYHNLLYWSNEHYLGIGVAASSYIDNRRYQNTKILSKYFNDIDKRKFPIDDMEILSKEDTLKHHIIQGFRKVQGINLKEYFNRYQTNIFEDFPLLNQFVQDGYFELINDFIRIKKEYFYVMDHFIEKLM